MDEVAITAARGRVFHKLNERSVRAVRFIQSRATLLACIKADGQALSPVVVHPHMKLQDRQVNAFNDAALLDVTPLHLTSGRAAAGRPTGAMTDYLFQHAMRTHVIPQLPRGQSSVVLLDGASSHFNPRLLIESRREHMIRTILHLLFSSPIHQTCHVLLRHRTTTLYLELFNALADSFYSRHTALQIELMSMCTAGQAFRENFTRRQIRSAFERRGYTTDKSKRQCVQSAVIAQLQKVVDAKSWTKHQVEEGKRLVLFFHSLLCKTVARVEEVDTLLVPAFLQ